MLPHLFYFLVLHSFYTDLAEREREGGWDTKEWERERGREVQKIFRFAKLQFYFGTKSDWGERE